MPTKPVIEEGSLSEQEAVKLLWDEWRYRHDLYWSSLYKWGASVVGITIAPYLLPDLILKLKLAVLVFPFLAFLLSCFAAWHLAAEYIRLIPVSRKYKSLLGKYAPEDIEKDTTLISQILSFPIGKLVSVIFLGFAFIIEFLNTLILFWLLVSV